MPRAALIARLPGDAGVEAHEAKHPRQHEADEERPPVHVPEREDPRKAVCHGHEERPRLPAAVIGEEQAGGEDEVQRGADVN